MKKSLLFVSIAGLVYATTCMVKGYQANKVTNITHEASFVTNPLQQEATYKKDRDLFITQKKQTLTEYPSLQEAMPGKSEALRNSCIDIATALCIDPNLSFDPLEHPYVAALCRPIPEEADDESLPFPKTANRRYFEKSGNR